MLKRIGAGLFGWVAFVAATLLFFIASGRDSHAPQSAGFIAVAAVVGILAAMLGGFVATRIASRSARFTAMFIAFGALGSILGSNDDARWSQVVALVLAVPAALVGGWLSERKRPTGEV
jgi:predicted permease